MTRPVTDFDTMQPHLTQWEAQELAEQINAAEQFPAPATVAAANDEGVTGEALFRAFMAGDVSRLTTTALPEEWPHMQPSYRKAWEDLAISLLSQGGGK
ncbi:hypothetical protein [Sphingomonas sp. PP-CC-1A-547]|uniref:hypothetical protein n=1 Tax=Sphingomonas sp. PP-CC-1A-547 TaxID=2135654 RepID=UPI000FEE4D7B|nr:hypothetical protein [Sphingomonas sp. PP-CC-1A-547]RKE50330.1 hypothetical protein C8J39_1900 [Sphingomonas sp. PP-CC-1A-547]